MQNKIYNLMLPCNIISMVIHYPPPPPPPPPTNTGGEKPPFTISHTKNLNPLLPGKKNSKVLTPPPPPPLQNLKTLGRDLTILHLCGKSYNFNYFFNYRSFFPTWSSLSTLATGLLLSPTQILFQFFHGAVQMIP